MLKLAKLIRGVFGLVDDSLKVLIQSLFILGLPFLFLALEKKPLGKSFAALGLQKKNIMAQIGLGVLLFIAVMGLLLIESLLFSYAGTSDTQKVVQVIAQQSLLGIIAVVIVSPIGEELLFRGYLQKKMGVPLSSILFAALHYGFGSVVEIAAALTASLAFGYFVKKKGVVLPTIIAHALVNAYSVAVVFYGF